VDAETATLEAQAPTVQEVDDVLDDDYAVWDFDVMDFHLDAYHADPFPGLRVLVHSPEYRMHLDSDTQKYISLSIINEDWEICSNDSASCYSSDGDSLSTKDDEEVIEDCEFKQAAIELLAPIDVEGLIAEPGLIENPNHDLLKSPAGKFYFEPHLPDLECRCHWCHIYHYPSADNMPGKHDPSEWCQCITCMIFCIQENRRQQDKVYNKQLAEMNAYEEKRRQKERRERQNEENRDKIVNNRIAKLRTEIDETIDEEESGFIDLMNYETREDTDVFDAAVKDGKLSKIWAAVRGVVRGQPSPLW
jgi:hypothetical protein